MPSRREVLIQAAGATLAVRTSRGAQTPDRFRGLTEALGRFQTTGMLILELDVAASREGFQIWMVFNDIFAAPQVRTGRERSPPPGRLP